MIEVSIVGLNGHITDLRLRSNNVNNIKKRIYNFFKAKNSDNTVDVDGVINKYHMKYQILLLNNELLQDNAVNDRDVITLVLDNAAIQNDVSKLQKHKELIKRIEEMIASRKLNRFN